MTQPPACDAANLAAYRCRLPDCAATANASRWAQSRLSSSSHLPAIVVLEMGKAGDVAARPRQSSRQSRCRPDRYDREHYRNGAVSLQQRHRGRCAGEDDIGRERSQFRRKSLASIGIERPPSGNRSCRLRPSIQPSFCKPLPKRRRHAPVLRVARRCRRRTPITRHRSAAARAPRAATPPPRRRAA